MSQPSWIASRTRQACQARRVAMGVVACLACAFWLAAEPIQAQNQADLDQFVQLENRYNREKRSGDWKAAGQTARQMVAFSQQRRMMDFLQLATIDYVAIAELNLGNFDEAMKLYKQVVAGCERARPAAEFQAIMHVTHFNGLNGIARCYRETGHLAEAGPAFQVAIKFARSVGQHDSAAAAGTDLGILLSGQGKYEEALAEFRQCLPTLLQAARKRNSSSEDKSTYAKALEGMALVYMNLGQYNKAEPLSRSAADWIDAANGKSSTFRALALKTLALIYSYQNRHDEAIQMYEEGLRIFLERDLADTPNCLAIMNNLALQYAITGQADKAIAMSTLALENNRARADESKSSLIVPLTNLASVYHQLSRYDEAAPHLKEALELCKLNLPPDDPKRTGVVRLHAGNEYLRGGDLPEVIEQLDQVVAIYQAVPTGPADLAAVYSIRASVYNTLGQRQKAEQDMEKALEYAELQRALSSGGERERATLFEDYSLGYGFLMTWSLEQGAAGIAKAFTIAETMKARSFMDALHTADFDILEELPEEERAHFQAEEKRLRDDLTTSQQQYDKLSESSPEQQRAAARAVYVARDRLYDHLVGVQNASPTHRRLIADSNRPATLETVRQELLQPQELLLSYAVFGKQMFVFSVSRDTADASEITVNDAQAEVLGIDAGPLGESDLTKILLGDEGLLSALSRPKDSSTLTPRLAALWQVLVPEPDRRAMLDGSLELVTILPDGLLALLPFETLVVSAADEDPEYLLDAGPPLAYAPSASVLLNLVRRPAYERSGDREPVLTLGDPDYGQAASGEGRAASFRAGLKRLPFSGYEAAWVAQLFNQSGSPSVKLTGGQATEAQLRRLASGREIVHLACHGMAEDQYGNFFGCLALAPGRLGDANDDGFLYTPEIYKLNLKGCELAILSACETNFGPQQTGEGVWTISRGFLVSGARRVLASNWVVDDAAGATLISYYAHELAKTTADSRRHYAAGLQSAKRSLRKQDKWSHPFYWSGLVLVGPN